MVLIQTSPVTLLLILVCYIGYTLGQPRNITHFPPGIVYTSQFVNWYPQFGFIFDNLRQNDCNQEYDTYLKGVRNNNSIQWYQGGDENNVLSEPVTQCILNGTSEFVKSAMSSAQVLLGLTPTMLAVLGVSTEELNLVTVVARRPILALLLALGSPSVFVSRAFEYNDPVEMLQHRPGSRPVGSLNRRAWRSAVLIIEYIVALGAMANVAQNNWALGIQTICSFWSNNPAAPGTWGLTVLPIHIVGALIMRLRVRRETLPGQYETVTWKQWYSSIPRRIRDSWRTEWQLSAIQEDIYLTAFRDRKLFLTLSWLLSTGIVCQVIFGTLVMSSLNFIGPRDALSVVGRYMLSVLACRVICMYEIAGMRERCKSIVLKYETPKEMTSLHPDVVDPSRIIYPVESGDSMMRPSKAAYRNSVVSKAVETNPHAVTET